MSDDDLSEKLVDVCIGHMKINDDVKPGDLIGDLIFAAVRIIIQFYPPDAWPTLAQAVQSGIPEALAVCQESTPTHDLLKLFDTTDVKPS